MKLILNLIRRLIKKFITSDIYAWLKVIYHEGYVNVNQGDILFPQYLNTISKKLSRIESEICIHTFPSYSFKNNDYLTADLWNDYIFRIGAIENSLGIKSIYKLNYKKDGEDLIADDWNNLVKRIRIATMKTGLA